MVLFSRTLTTLVSVKGGFETYLKYSRIIGNLPINKAAFHVFFTCTYIHTEKLELPKHGKWYHLETFVHFKCNIVMEFKRLHFYIFIGFFVPAFKALLTVLFLYK